MYIEEINKQQYALILERVQYLIGNNWTSKGHLFQFTHHTDKEKGVPRGQISLFRSALHRSELPSCQYVRVEPTVTSGYPVVLPLHCVVADTSLPFTHTSCKHAQWGSEFLSLATLSTYFIDICYLAGL